MEAAKNASGEIVDWDSGADLAVQESERTPFSGGKRVLVDGLMTRRQTAVMAAVFYVLATAAGLLIVVYREPQVFWLGIAGMALAFFYHAPPFSLSYRGLGEFAVGLAYGPIIACGTYLVQRHSLSAEVLLGVRSAGPGDHCVSCGSTSCPTPAPTPRPASALWSCGSVTDRRRAPSPGCSP